MLRLRLCHRHLPHLQRLLQRLQLGAEQVQALWQHRFLILSLALARRCWPPGLGCTAARRAEAVLLERWFRALD